MKKCHFAYKNEVAGLCSGIFNLFLLIAQSTWKDIGGGPKFIIS